MGILSDLADGLGTVLGTAAGIAAAPFAIALDVTVESAQRAIDAGCTTVDEVRRFLDLDPWNAGLETPPAQDFDFGNPSPGRRGSALRPGTAARWDVAGSHNHPPRRLD